MFMKKPRISIIGALGTNRAIGKDNELLWHIPDDLKRFKKLTFGCPVIMGRKTFESITRYVGGPLPGRTNFVLTRKSNSDLGARYGVVVEASLEEAIRKASLLDSDEVFIGGGAEVYAQAFPLADRLYLTLIDDNKEGDSHFPEYEHLFANVIENEAREWQGLAYYWRTLEH